MAWRKSSCAMGCSEMTQSPEGNRARGFLPKSMTTSMRPPISVWRYSSLRNVRGSSSRKRFRSSGRDVDGEEPQKRSEGRRISGEAVHGIPFLGKRGGRREDMKWEIYEEHVRIWRPHSLYYICYVLQRWLLLLWRDSVVSSFLLLCQDFRGCLRNRIRCSQETKSSP